MTFGARAILLLDDASLDVGFVPVVRAGRWVACPHPELSVTRWVGPPNSGIRWAYPFAFHRELCCIIQMSFSPHRRWYVGLLLRLLCFISQRVQNLGGEEESHRTLNRSLRFSPTSEYRIGYFKICNQILIIQKIEHLFFFLNAYLFILRERESTHTGGAEREGDRESQAGSTLSSQSLMWGSNSWTERSWPELKSRVGHLTDRATQVPLEHLLF